MRKFLLLVSALIGIVLGIIATRFLFVGSSLSLIPWGIAGLILGWLSVNKRETVLNGCVYGFFLIFTFMLSGYTGKASIITRIPPFAILGLVGAVCGLVLSIIGFYSKRKLHHS